MASRKIEDMHPWLAERWKIAIVIWNKEHPKGPIPIITQNYRSPQEQNDLYAQGRTKKGNRVTNAKGGQSLHNYLPSYAFDIAFKNTEGKILWDEKYFNEFAVIMKGMGVGWGGDWKSFKDRPHFDFKGYTWQMAANGVKPNTPPLPDKYKNIVK